MGTTGGLTERIASKKSATTSRIGTTESTKDSFMRPLTAPLKI